MRPARPAARNRHQRVRCGEKSSLHETGIAATTKALNCFFEGVSNEPEHAPDFAQEIATQLTDVLNNHNRIRRNCFARCRVSLVIGHFDEKLPQLIVWKSRKLKRLAPKQCG